MKCCNTHRRDTGAVLIFALLILVVGAVVLGAIAQLAATQATSGEAEWGSAARRIMTQNSRALARQFVQSWMFRGTGQVPWPFDTTQSPRASFGNNTIGGFSILAVTPVNGFWRSTPGETDPDRVNPFNLFERGGFQSSWIEARLYDPFSGSNAVPWAFQVRTRSPILAGFAFLNHLPTNNNTTVFSPRMNFESGGNIVGYSGMPRMPLTSVTNTAGDSTGFQGWWDIPMGEVRSFGDPYSPLGVTNTNVGVNVAGVTLNLAVFKPRFVGSEMSAFSFAASTQLDTDTNGVADSVNLFIQGQNPASSDTSLSRPVRIVCGDHVQSVTLTGNNLRPLYLYLTGVNPIVITCQGTTPLSWVIGISTKRSITFQPADGLAITGGLRTDAVMNLGSLPVPVAQNATNVNYDAIGDRIMWLEDMRLAQ